MVQVYTPALQQSLHISDRGGLPIDRVLALVILVGGTSNDELRVRDDFECIISRLN